MNEDELDKARAAADDVLAFAEEVTAAGDAAVEGSELASARALLHTWIDTVTGVVNIPALGRVTLIHANGGQSTILSPDLPFVMSKPVNWKQNE